MTKGTNTLRSILAARGMRYANLAKLAGLAPGTVKNIASGNNPSRKGRAKIETALGCAIWPKVPTAPAKHTTAAPLQEPCSPPSQ